MIKLSPSCLYVVGEVLRLTLWEVIATVLIASCMMDCDWSCGLGRLRNRVDEKPSVRNRIDRKARRCCRQDEEMRSMLARSIVVWM